MCSRCDWESVLDQVQEMLRDDDFDFAHDTLSGIAEWIEENEHVTERQEDAVANIRESVERRGR